MTDFYMTRILRRHSRKVSGVINDSNGVVGLC